MPNKRAKETEIYTYRQAAKQVGRPVAAGRQLEVDFCRPAGVLQVFQHQKGHAFGLEGVAAHAVGQGHRIAGGPIDGLGQLARQAVVPAPTQVGIDGTEDRSAFAGLHLAEQHAARQAAASGNPVVAWAGTDVLRLPVRGGVVGHGRRVGIELHRAFDIFG
jgi:hypothetical protein